MKRPLLLVVSLVVVMTATTAGCHSDDDSKGTGDAPVATASGGERGGDDAPARCTNMPDGFGNVCTKCVAGAKPWRIIATTNTSYSPSNFVLVQDPKACGGDWVSGARYVPASTGNGVESEDDS